MQVRPALQALVRKALSHESTSLGADGPEDTFSRMMVDIGASKPSKDETKSENDLIKQIIATQAVQQTCEGWLQLNNDTETVVNHPAFSKYMSDLKIVTGCTCDDWDGSACPFHESSTTIADFLWGLAMTLAAERAIPLEVPVLACGCMMQCEAECAAYLQRKQNAAEQGEQFTEKVGIGPGSGLERM